MITPCPDCEGNGVLVATTESHGEHRLACEECHKTGQVGEARLTPRQRAAVTRAAHEYGADGVIAKIRKGGDYRLVVVVDSAVARELIRTPDADKFGDLAHEASGLYDVLVGRRAEA